MKNFGHVITAMITPFTKQGDIDFQAAISLAQHCFDNGSDTVLLAGTTGESPTLTHDEEFQLFKTVKKAVGPNCHIMAGAGSNCTKTAILATKKAKEAGVDSVLQVVPYYNKPSQEGLFQHFTHIADSTDLPIMLYNIPGRTGKNLEPITVQRFTNSPNICAIKEASGSVDAVQQLRSYMPESFDIYSGDDACTVEFMKAGAKGVVSVASHLVGNQLQQMVQLVLAGDTQQAEQINLKLASLFKVLFITANPVPVKAALRLLGKKVGSVRLPLVDATDAEVDEIKQVLQTLNII
tara:strand:- start:1295 stop:2176 length:882 start_codon:yes stop_codon:yes gene_type:complete